MKGSALELLLLGLALAAGMTGGLLLIAALGGGGVPFPLMVC